VRRTTETHIRGRIRYGLKLLGLLVSIGPSFIYVSAQDRAPASSPTPARSAADKPTGGLSGRVSDDNGRPIADATVMVFRPGGNSDPVNEGTDEAGRFTIKRLPSGAYSLRVRSPGYVQSEDELRDANGLSRLYRTGEDVSLTLVKGGVITGTVSDQSGEPMVGMTVTAVRLKQPDEVGGPLDEMFGTTRTTDDRGIYRIYGLRSGRYIVFAGGGERFSPRSSPFDRDAPTYYPSSTRDTASAIDLQAGQEASGTDIRYRGEKGFVISGTITGQISKFTILSLAVPGNLTPVGSAFAQEVDGRVPFAFSNVTNGDYRIVAFNSDQNGGQAAVGTVAASVKNGDITGLTIKLSPLGSISGRFVLTETSDAKCQSKTSSRLDQIVLAIVPEKKAPENIFTDFQHQSGADADGAFRILSVNGGNYRLRTTLPTDEWYIKSISKVGDRTQSGSTQAKPTSSPAELIAVNGGENLTGLNIELSTGAGLVTGSVAGAPEESGLLRRLYLVPAEKERADDTLRFSNTLLSPDGSFSFRNLAPGHYFLLAKVENDASDKFRPLEWDPKERAALLRSSVASGFAVEIKPCKLVADLQLVAGADGSIKTK